MNKIATKPRLFADGQAVIYVSRQRLLGLPRYAVGEIAAARLCYPNRRRRILFEVVFPLNDLRLELPASDLRSFDARNIRKYKIGVTDDATTTTTV